MGYFRKDIDNYIGVTTIESTAFDLPHPGIGAGYYDGGGGQLSGGRSHLYPQLHLRESRW